MNRIGFIGGSDMRRIMEGDWISLWEEKTGRTKSADLSDVLPVQLGSFTEQFNINWFQQQTDKEVYDQQRVVKLDVDGVPCRVLKTKGAEAVLKRGLPLVAGINSALRMKRELKLSLWQTLRAGLSMAKAQQLAMAKLPVLAVGLSQMAKGIEDGDEDGGLMLAGQNCGLINDVPTCAEVMEQIVAKAKEVIHQKDAL